MKVEKQTTLTLLIICFIALVSCHKNPTEPKTGTLTGTVLLKGEQDHSGITVAFTPLDNEQKMKTMMCKHYNINNKAMGNICISNGVNKLAELATTILRYNREYPLARRLFGGNVGFPISQTTEFDHRLGEVVAETKTKQDGSFKIENVLEGLYNFVAQKQGFGWKYIYNVQINSGSTTSMTRLINNSMTKFLNDRMTYFPNYTTNINQLFIRQARQPYTFLSFNLHPLSLNNHITLYPVTEANGTLSNDTVWHRDRHYIVTGDVIVPVGTELKAETGAVVRFDGYYKILVEGNLQAVVGEQDNMVVFTPLDACYLTGFTSNKELPEKGDWGKLEFENIDSANVLKWCRIEYSNVGIACEKASPRVLTPVN